MKYGYIRSVQRNEAREAMQKEALLSAGVSADNIYVDHTSGRIFVDDRPGWTELVANVNADDKLIIDRVDRIGRSELVIHSAITDLLDRGVTSHFLEVDIDSSTRDGARDLKRMLGFMNLSKDSITTLTR